MSELECAARIPLVSEPSRPELDTWASWVRGVAPYVHHHRGRTFVISMAGGLVADKALLNRFVTDASLIASLGVRLVLVPGCRPWVEELMRVKGIPPRYHKGVRVTDAATLECVKQASGASRLEIEAAFSQGLPNTPMQHARMRVISGNFVTARPMGVIDGVDFQGTGLVRK
ncbi:MAG: N-acetylglutamate synthase, partial [Duodenibacillus sp.]|nr:N-acetylglutamate synthase [Duodenibacillus sp.]